MKLIDRDLLKKKLDQRFSEDILAGRVGGLNALVVQNGEIVYRTSMGRANGETAVGTKTMFRLASMTKPITAVATMIAVERGLLSLDDPVSKYLPQYEKMQIASLAANGEPRITGQARTPITVRHLLSHSSGIGCGELGVYYVSKMTDRDRADLNGTVDYYSKLPLSFEPFTEQAYSPFAAFDVLARIIELVTGEEYGAFLKKSIFDPCEMKDTTFTPSEEQWARMIEMHNYQNGEAIAVSMLEGCVFESFPQSHALAGAGLASTVDDYARFAEMLINGGEIFGNRILSSGSIDQIAMTQCPHPMKGGNSHWGLSVRVITNPAYVLPLGTFGWSGAYGTHFWIDRTNGIFAIYLKNSKYDGGSGAKTAYHFEEDVYTSMQ